MPAIVVENVRKKFRAYYDKGYHLKERLLFRNRSRYEDRWILDDISFEVNRGEAVGLIGHNGCGKSTLLKLMSKIMYPNSGTIRITGRVSSLIELGAGFHPDMSGRENIYTNASIFGLSHKEISKRVDDIIAFSELEEFIDNPVRTYSSGMYMRLAFAVAINVDADVILIDEILAVGDANFQKKCINKIEDLKNTGVTIVIVSHDHQAIERICDLAIWINDGKIVFSGNPKEATVRYLEYMAERQEARINQDHGQEASVSVQAPEKRENTTTQSAEGELTQKENTKEEKTEPVKPEKAKEKQKKRWGSRELEITNVEMLNASGKKGHVFKIGSRVQVVIEYVVHSPKDSLNFGIDIFSLSGINCYGVNTSIDRIPVDSETIQNSGRVILDIDRLNLIEGTYWLNTAIVSKDGYPYDYIIERYQFSTVSPIKDVGIARLDHSWSFHPN